MARESLEKYFGKYVWIEGKYVGPPIRHERTGYYFSNQENAFVHPKNNVIRASDEERATEDVSPISFPEYASCTRCK